MDVQERKLTVSKLVQAFVAGSLLRNSEYQRGAAWSEHQKAAFIDSIFRGYPVPAVFLHMKEVLGLDDTPSKKYEIIDGQQRLIALRDYREQIFSLPELGEGSPLRLPKSVQNKKVPWSGKAFGELSPEIAKQFLDYSITVFEVGSSAESDEIRDLFIRLQSGTALARQQIRDAWPGRLGPFIERVAGKLTLQPSCQLFSVADKRGHGAEDEEVDPYTNDRQFAASLLGIFLARERDPLAIPQTRADDIDSLYHEHTDWNPDSESSVRFIATLRHAASVFNYCQIKFGKKKFTRSEITVVVMYIQDMSRSSQSKLTEGFLEKVADTLVEWKISPTNAQTRRSSAKYLRLSYDNWRRVSPDSALIRLDGQRLFSTSQKAAAYQAQQEKCGVCYQHVEFSAAEFDHYPIPHRDGGPTSLENCRVVHARCHQRGRPSED